MIEFDPFKIDKEQCLSDYQRYMENTRGFALLTQRSYLAIARKFLQSCTDADLAFTATAVVDFVMNDAGRRKGQGPNTTISAMRSFLRFLVSKGWALPGLDGIVPRIRCYRNASLPVCLTALQIEQVLALANDSSGKGKRNYALVLLLSRLGLRIDEAARLQLEDINWRDGCLLIRAGKNRTERKLPLPDDVGSALLDYLQHSRPKSLNRHVFLQLASSNESYKGSSLGKVIKRLLKKAGIQQTSIGAHSFRHSTATQLINHGASFKEIADLLGHQSLSATALYAKLDFRTLAEIALPWPGDDSK